MMGTPHLSQGTRQQPCTWGGGPEVGQRLRTQPDLGVHPPNQRSAIMQSPVHQQPYLGMSRANLASEVRRQGWELEPYAGVDVEGVEGGTFEDPNAPGPYTQHHVSPSTSQLDYNDEADEAFMSYYIKQAPPVTAYVGRAFGVSGDMMMLRMVWASCNIALLGKNPLYW